MNKSILFGAVCACMMACITSSAIAARPSVSNLTSEIEATNQRVDQLEGRTAALEQQVQTLSNAVIPLLPQSATFDLSTTGLSLLHPFESNGFLWINATDASANAYILKVNAGDGSPAFQVPIFSFIDPTTHGGEICTDGTDIHLFGQSSGVIVSTDGTLTTAGSKGRDCEFDGTYMWYVEGTNVRRYDPASGTTVSRTNGTFSPLSLTVDDTYIWVLRQSGSGSYDLVRIAKLNFGQTSSLSARFFLGGGSRAVLEGDGNSLWLTRGGALEQYPKSAITSLQIGTDISSLRSSLTLNVASNDPASENVRVLLDGSNVWVFSSALGTVSKVVQSNGLFVESINLGPGITGFTLDSLYYYYVRPGFSPAVVEKVLK